MFFLESQIILQFFYSRTVQIFKELTCEHRELPSIHRELPSQHRELLYVGSVGEGNFPHFLIKSRELPYCFQRTIHFLGNFPKQKTVIAENMGNFPHQTI